MKLISLVIFDFLIFDSTLFMFLFMKGFANPAMLMKLSIVLSPLQLVCSVLYQVLCFQ